MIVWFAPWAAIFLIGLWLRRGRYDVTGLMDACPGTVGHLRRSHGIHLPGVVAQLAGMAAAAAWVHTSVWQGPLGSATGSADMSVWMGLGVAGALYFVMGNLSVRQEARASQPTPQESP